MTNLHTPERLQGESFGDYKVRRAKSNAQAGYERLFHDSYKRGTFRAGRRAIKFGRRLERELQKQAFRAAKREGTVQ